MWSTGGVDDGGTVIKSFRRHKNMHNIDTTNTSYNEGPYFHRRVKDLPKFRFELQDDCDK